MSKVIEIANALLQSMAGADFTDDEAEHLVRFVIEAMREPTAAMIKAGCLTGDHGYEEVMQYWRPMIVAALADDITANPVKATERPSAGHIPFPAGSYRAES